MSLSQRKRKRFKYIYGPVSSWRLGRSLGVDILSQDKKTCTFDCLYCQLGSRPEKVITRKIYVPTEEVVSELKNLPPALKMDYITFSGNGEPALAKNLGDIIRKIRRIRREKLAVITNASFMRSKKVRRDLSLADLVVAKIDACSEELFRKINKPAKGISFNSVYNGIKVFRKNYKGRFALQIMFTPQNRRYFKEIAKIAYKSEPDEIQINTPTRPNPIKPISKNEILEIAAYFKAYGKNVKARAKVISVYETKPKRTSAMNRKDTIRRRGTVV